MSCGIALSGGGVGGVAHVGVLKALEEENMLPSCIAGTSAGAIVGGLYACGMNVKQLEALVQELSKNGRKLIQPDYIGIIQSIFQLIFRENLTLSGLLFSNKLEKMLSDLTNGISIKATKIPVALASLNINNGRTIGFVYDKTKISKINGVDWIDDVKLSEAICASAAVPLIFQPRFINELRLVDSGVTDNLPTNMLIAMGERNILDVSISAPDEAPSADNLLEIGTHSIALMGSRLQKYIATGAKAVLSPRLPEDTSLLSFSKMELCIEADYKAAKDAMSTLKKLLL
jgi:NTE family protein